MAAPEVELTPDASPSAFSAFADKALKPAAAGFRWVRGGERRRGHAAPVAVLWVIGVR